MENHNLSNKYQILFVKLRQVIEKCSEYENKFCNQVIDLLRFKSKLIKENEYLRKINENFIYNENNYKYLEKPYNDYRNRSNLKNSISSCKHLHYLYKKKKFLKLNESYLNKDKSWFLENKSDKFYLNDLTRSYNSLNEESCKNKFNNKHLSDNVIPISSLINQEKRKMFQSEIFGLKKDENEEGIHLNKNINNENINKDLIGKISVIKKEKLLQNSTDLKNTYSNEILINKNDKTEYSKIFKKEKYTRNINEKL